MIAVVIENLGARTTRTGGSHLPKVIRGRDADDPLIWQACDLFPQVCGLFVSVIDSYQQAFFWNAKPLGQKFPSIGDRFFFEIVAKAEVAQHLKKGVVARGIADIVEVIMLAPRPHTFLCRGGTGVIARFKPREQVFELHHAGVDEHQRWIVARDERAGRDHGVALFFEIAQKGRTDVIKRWHGGCFLRRAFRLA